jgi:hypothetical protein
VRLWQTVMVQRAASSSSAIGRPTMLDWPMITASSPSKDCPVRASSVMTPFGVHGRSSGMRSASRPTL